MPRRIQLKRYSLQPARNRAIKPPQRVDISKLTRSQREECRRYGDVAEQWLIRKQYNPLFTQDELHDLGAAMRKPPHKAFELLLQAQRYKVGYPEQPIANAFAPIIRIDSRIHKRKRHQ